MCKMQLDIKHQKYTRNCKCCHLCFQVHEFSVKISVQRIFITKKVRIGKNKEQQASRYGRCASFRSRCSKATFLEDTSASQKSRITSYKSSNVCSVSSKKKLCNMFLPPPQCTKYFSCMDHALLLIQISLQVCLLKLSLGNKKFLGAEHLDLMSQPQSVFSPIGSNKVFIHSKCNLHAMQVLRFYSFVLLYCG